MSISKEQWKAIAEELDRFMPTVNFMIDGHKITINKEGYGKMQLALAVYIDGQIWMAQSQEEHEDFNPVTHKVWFKKSMWHYSPVKQKKMIKELGKRRAKEYFPNLEEKSFFYMPCFTSSRTLIGQYKKLEGLELVKLGSETFGEQVA